jgi:hypothetical protein
MLHGDKIMRDRIEMEEFNWDVHANLSGSIFLDEAKELEPEKYQQKDGSYKELPVEHGHWVGEVGGFQLWVEDK